MSRVITPADWRAQPWKNGGGVTHEIVRWPDVTDYDVRVSVADVSRSGPFSRFPGYHRWSLLLAGGPILVDDLELRTNLLVCYPGDRQVVAAIASPARLLNIIGKPGTVVGVGAPTIPIRFAFALEPHDGLGRWSSRVSGPARDVDPGPMIWVA